MAKFRIQSHGRLQEWVAEEKDTSRMKGWTTSFCVKPIATWSSNVESTESAPDGGAARRLRVHRRWPGMRS